MVIYQGDLYSCIISIARGDCRAGASLVLEEIDIRGHNQEKTLQHRGISFGTGEVSRRLLP